MALVSSLPTGSGPVSFYNIPDEELEKYRVQMQELTDAEKQQMFPGKENPGKEDATGVMPAAMVVGGDVQAYNQDICYIYNRYTGEILRWWYC